MKEIIIGIACKIAACLIYSAVIAIIIGGIITLFCGVYYFNVMYFTLGFVIFAFGELMWLMLQDM